MSSMDTDWAWISAIGVIAGFAVTFAGFWLRFGSRIGKAESAAAAAQAAADDAKLAAKEAESKTALLTASFSLYREQVAREYIHREVMREVEDRLTAAIRQLGDRLDRFVDKALARAPQD